MSNTTFIIHFHSTEWDLLEFGEAMQQLAVELPKVSGCSAVSVFRDRDDRARFTVVETWDSRPDHEQHIAGLVADGAWDRLSGLLRSEPSSSYFDSV